MNDTRISEKAVFKLAHSFESTALCEEYLNQVCRDDPELRGRVALLLQMQAEEPDFLESPAATVTVTSDLPEVDLGSCIGPYKLRELLGEGGMGVVYVAEQEEPIRRMVALKIVKPGMDSAQVIARFEAERQALALMDHPNIARVVDAGTTSTGRPYFAMDLVRGVPITQFCDEHQLTTRERLKLFVEVCQAIQHAHQKGIIHRDIKPSNVLVTLHDDQPVPKVIDFGIAKATSQLLTDKGIYTGFTQMIGTPLYMSPEQAEMNNFDVDTRSDVYSLGVLLYELLTGATPFDKDHLQTAGFDEMRHLIREVDPPSPSMRFSTLGAETASTVSRSRRVDERQLSRVLRGELDWIAMRALEKDRNRRYESASALVADIQRYLSDEPVLACPPSPTYRLRKFFGRNRGLALAAASVLLVLIGGLTSTTFGLLRAERSRQQATEQRSLAEANEARAFAAAHAERQAKETAQAREAEIAAVVGFLEEKVLAAARPEGEVGGLGWDVTLREAIDSALPYLDKNFTQQPLIEARLRRTVGFTFWILGDGTKAVAQLEKARELYQRHRGLDHPDTLFVLNFLAMSLHRAGRFDEAVQIGERTLPLRKAVLGSDHPDTLEGMHNLAFHYNDVRRFEDAVRLGEETLALRKARFGADGPQTLMTMGVLAISYFNAGRHDEAIRLHEQTLALKKEKFGHDWMPTLFTMHALANAYASLGRHADALKLSEETYFLFKKKLGPEHPETRFSRSQLSGIYRALGKFDKVIALREETLEGRQAKYGPNDQQTLISMDELARELANCPNLALRDPARAVSLAKHAVDGLPKSLPAWHAWNTLAEAHYRAGNYQAAVATVEKACQLNSRLPYARFVEAMAQFQLGNSASARSWYEEAVELMEMKGPKDAELPRVRAECESVLSITDTP